MLTVYNCIVNDHDLSLVVLAAIICAISALTAVTLLGRVNRPGQSARAMWIGLTACAIGFGIWATHFVAMLAFSPTLPTAYDAPLTALSLAIAVAVTGLGVTVATLRNTLDHRLVGGSIIGAGIAAMHFIGMAALEVPGVLMWDQRFVAVALVVAILMGALAIQTALTKGGAGRSALAALLLTIGICGLHFIAMAAVTIQPDASITIPAESISSFLLALGVTAVALTILAFAGIASWVDLRDYKRDRIEEQRVRDLVNAAVEGLVVCHNDKIVTANASFLALSGRTIEDIEGTEFSELVVGIDPNGEGSAADGFVLRQDDTRLPIEVITRVLDYDGKPHTIYAIRDLRERRKAEADIRHLAMHDPLTGLPNRRSFNETLEREIDAHRSTYDRQLALLCLDLDRFKEVNDLFGHAAGDALLQRVADCLGKVVKREHVVARLGGDEFAIILPGLRTPKEAEDIACDIFEAFDEENRTAINSGLMATSVGIALCPADTDDALTLVNHADTALYCAKSEGRGTWRRFNRSMGDEVRSRRLIEHELRHAVSRDQFTLVYQPQKELATNQTVGFEALLRWKHPERGMISPDVFIPIAEESGLIVPIGEWVMEKACTDALRWADHVTVAVNVSAVQLHSAEFAKTVESILTRTGLSPQRLEIEITETALVRDMNRALTTLRQIKSLGVKVAMDDFGTGYSSLANLRAFPFDKIKIDGSFIRSVDSNPQAATIVKAVLGIGRGLGLPVLAEGVETSQELEFLAKEFCQIGQGYLLGRPATLDATEGAEEQIKGTASAA